MSYSCWSTWNLGSGGLGPQVIRFRNIKLVSTAVRHNVGPCQNGLHLVWTLPLGCMTWGAKRKSQQVIQFFTFLLPIVGGHLTLLNCHVVAILKRSQWQNCQTWWVWSSWVFQLLSGVDAMCKAWKGTNILVEKSSTENDKFVVINLESGGYIDDSNLSTLYHGDLLS